MRDPQDAAREIHILRALQTFKDQVLDNRELGSFEFSVQALDREGLPFRGKMEFSVEAVDSREYLEGIMTILQDELRDIYRNLGMSPLAVATATQPPPIRMTAFTVSIKKDLCITWFAGKGGGGQYRNRHKNCCRIQHKQSGALVTGQSHRERKHNKREALANLIANPRFRRFCEIGLEEIEEGVSREEKITAWVDEMMQEEFIEEVSDEKFRLATKGKKKETINGVEVWT